MKQGHCKVIKGSNIAALWFRHSLYILVTLACYLDSLTIQNQMKKTNSLLALHSVVHQNDLDDNFDKLPVLKSTCAVVSFTSSDSVWKVLKYLQDGCPTNLKWQHPKFLDSLSVSEGCIIFSNRIFIPEKLCKIGTMVNKCSLCSENSKFPVKLHYYIIKITLLHPWTNRFLVKVGTSRSPMSML